jgi:hypothetical protein
MATFVKFYDFVEQLAAGTHHFGGSADVFKVYLTNATPSLTDDHIKTELAGITEENGYAAADIQNAIAGVDDGIATITAEDVTWTANHNDDAGGFGPFRYIVIYNDTATDDPLVGYVDYGSSITVNDGETFTVNFGASLMTIQ